MKPDLYPTHPKHIWDHFYHFTQIPRPSRSEEKIVEHIKMLADELGHPIKQDKIGNLVIYVPGTHGKESSAPVIIQNHVDMVTVKSNDSDHDFYKDPLSLSIEAGWLTANKTTLGADNGLGCAAALALMTDQTVERPPLELLFTMDEETGLNGASGLDASMLTGKVMLNLDTEDWQELYVGCAGGKGWRFNRPVSRVAAPDNSVFMSMSLSRLTGGHSGIQIHHQLGNANKLLGYWLKAAAALGVRVSGYHAGVAHNVIAREGRVNFSLPEKNIAELEALNKRLKEEWLTWLPESDSGLTLTLSAGDAANVLSDDSQKILTHWLLTFPHGAQSYNFAHPADLVNLSINMAVVSLSDVELMTEASCRFFNEKESLPLVDTVLALAEQFQMTPKIILDYPGWQPDFDSPLLAQAKELHLNLFQIDPEIKAIHAGLECGILKSKKPDMDILSFGPNIRGAHSPSERLEISTVEPFWQFLVALLRRL